MQLGHHFSKQKPRWNALNETAQLYFESIENTILKNSFLISTLQFLILAPILFWTLENYSLFEQLIPIKTHLKENLVAEKNWILFLFASSYVLSLFANYQILKMLTLKIRQIEKLNLESMNQNSNDRIFSFDEAVVRRRAS